jgi:ribosomal protein L37E
MVVVCVVGFFVARSVSRVMRILCLRVVWFRCLYILVSRFKFWAGFIRFLTDKFIYLFYYIRISMVDNSVKCVQCGRSSFRYKVKERKSYCLTCGLEITSAAFRRPVGRLEDLDGNGKASG